MAAQLSLHLPIVGKGVEGDDGARDSGLLGEQPGAMQQCPGLTARYSAYLVEGREVSPRRQAGKVMRVNLTGGRGRAGMRWTRRIQRRLRPRSTVTVTVSVNGGAEHLDDCIESLLDSRVVSQILLVAGDGQAAEVLRDHHRPEGRVRVLGGSDPSESLGEAVAAAQGKWLAFADAGDVIPPGAFERLLAAAGRETDVVLGIDSGSVGRPPWLAQVPGDGTRLLERAEDHPHVLVDLVLPAKLFRRDFWGRAEISVQGHHSAAPAVMRSLLTANGVALTSVEAYSSQSRDRSLPVGRQRRYDEAHAREVSGSLRQASDILARRSEVAWRPWAEAALEHVLPQLYVDSVAGGPAYLEALAPLARHLLGGLDDDDLRRVPVSARLGGWFATHKGWDDVALLQGFLADHPHGLPVDRVSSQQVAVTLPGHLNESTPTYIREICAGDRRLHAKVDPPTTTPEGHLELRGARLPRLCRGRRSPRGDGRRRIREPGGAPGGGCA